MLVGWSMATVMFHKIIPRVSSQLQRDRRLRKSLICPHTTILDALLRPLSIARA